MTKAFDACERAGRDRGTDTQHRTLPALLTLFSPAFPIGGFSWSHGLESAIADGRVTSPAEVHAWVDFLLQQGSGWNDCVLLVAAYRAVASDDAARLVEVVELSRAMATSTERRRETLALGAAFAEASAAWSPGEEGGDDAAGEEAAGIAYPVAVGKLAAKAQLPLGDTLVAFAHAFAASLVSAAVRLVPLAQSDAVRILHVMETVIEDVALRAARSTLDDLGSAAIGSDIAAMRHETLRTRLFRS